MSRYKVTLKITQVYEFDEVEGDDEQDAIDEAIAISGTCHPDDSYLEDAIANLIEGLEGDENQA